MDRFRGFGNNTTSQDVSGENFGLEGLGLSGLECELNSYLRSRETCFQGTTLPFSLKNKENIPGAAQPVAVEFGGVSR